MLSDFARAAGSPAAAAEALETAIRGYPYDVVATPDRFEYHLPDRPPLPWYRPRANLRRRFGTKAQETQAYEPVATAALDHILDHGAAGAVYDIGAAAGYFGFLGAARCTDPRETHCFEMRPQDCALIAQMAARMDLPHLHAHLSGMSDAHRGPRDIWFSVTKMFEAEPDPSVYRDRFWWRVKFWLQGRPGRDRLTRASVMIDSIDAFTGRHALAPALVKIDVDGYEAKVLPGGMTTFAQHRPVIFLELHKTRFFAHLGATRTGIVRPLFDLGYSCLFFSNHHSLVSNRIRPVGPDDPLLEREETDFMLFV